MCIAYRFLRVVRSNSPGCMVSEIRDGLAFTVYQTLRDGGKARWQLEAIYDFENRRIVYSMDKFEP